MEERSNLYIFILLAFLIGAGLMWGAFQFVPQMNSESTVLTSGSADYYEAAGYKLHDPLSHGFAETDPDRPIPSVDLTVERDAMSGFNLSLGLQNFTLTPDRATELSQINNEGHAHLMINGYKITRLYASDYYIDHHLLRLGENTVNVTLNANDHSDWTYQSEPISAEIIVTKTQDDEVSRMDWMEMDHHSNM